MSRDGSSNRRKRQPAEPPKNRAALAALHGEVWDTEELARIFVVTAIIGTTLVVRRKSDNCVGTIEVQQGPPQFYYNFTPQPPAE
jgi:hypothetical protein